MVSFIVESIVDRAVVRTTIDARTLKIGRGANADLRSDNPAVSLEHAVIEGDNIGYTITDLGSLTGTYVDGRAVESARLNRGDRIEIGDLRLEVQRSDPAMPLVIRVVGAREVAGSFSGSTIHKVMVARPGQGSLVAPVVDYGGAFSLRRPYLTKAILAVILVIGTVAAVAGVMRKENNRVMMPGGLASAHARVRVDCQQCHEPFRTVADAKCQECHRQTAHAPHTADDPPCASCHSEHRGQVRLASIPEHHCSGCHARLEPSVHSFVDGHPQFIPLPDESSLRFNHALHLRTSGVQDGSGERVTLECASCHQLSGEPEKIEFEEHCRDCHRLTFDARFPQSEVPHGGDRGMVVGFIAATLSGDRDLMSRSPVELRRMMTTRQPVPVTQRAILAAEGVIKNKCQQCHGAELESPAVRARFFESATFSHDKHRQVECAGCHRNVENSTDTEDVLLPSRDDCTECHGPHAETGASSCVTCHWYHPPRGSV
jgi:hypothetical protein